MTCRLMSIQVLWAALQVSIRGHETRSARLANGQPVPVAAGETIEFEAVGEDYIKWTGGRLADEYVKIGLSLKALTACKLGDVILVDDGNMKVEVTGMYRPEASRSAQHTGFSRYGCMLCLYIVFQ